MTSDRVHAWATQRRYTWIHLALCGFAAALLTRVLEWAT